eukprot:symbB.v1.2.009379.t1/scaffold595.1/size183375/1
MSMLLSLPGLSELDLSFNNLKYLTLPGVSGVSRSSLTFMDLSGNNLEFSGILGMLEACPKLQELRLRNCNLQSLEDWQKIHNHLEILDLEENRLSMLSGSLVTLLPKLKTLLLANNDLRSTLPMDFGYWESLQVVTLTGNPLKALRQALVAKGWSAVAQHLRKQRLEVEEVNVVPPARPCPKTAASPELATSEPVAPLAAHLAKLQEGRVVLVVQVGDG